jgi:hypothetical protein
VYYLTTCPQLSIFGVVLGKQKLSTAIILFSISDKSIARGFIFEILAVVGVIA